jgi:hypothetical protein
LSQRGYRCRRIPFDVHPTAKGVQCYWFILKTA